MLELAGIIILGILAQWVAWRMKVPAILPLILIGLLIGPISTLYTESGCKLLQPMAELNPSCSNFLFPGEYLFSFVSLAIGIILFEGGLTLKQKEIADVGPVIGKLISLGSLVTFIGAGLAAHYLMDLNWAISFLFSGLIIVTGPTVIAPILQNVPLTRNIATVLKWEGILIDPIGALTAVLVFEFIISGGSSHGMEFTAHAFKTFAQIILIGLALGTLAALALRQMIKNNWIPHYLLNVFTLAMVLGVFVFSDQLAHESGLLSVVVMGMVLGNLNVPNLKEILFFKEALSVLLISILFILLAANIDIKDLQLLLDWRVAALFATTIFVLRPIGVFLSTRKSDLTLREKLFISWVGPRGIVAAGIASLFGIKLIADGVQGAEYITPLVFMIVMGTVLLNATTARFMARILGVTLSASDGILIIGANAAGRLIGKYLKDSGRHVVLVDNNESHINKSHALGLEAFQANVYTEELSDLFELVDIGFMMSLTASAEVNQYTLDKFEKNFGERGSFRLISGDEMKMKLEDIPQEGLFSPYDDYINLMEVVRDHPHIQEIAVDDKDAFIELLATINKMHYSIPLFLKDSSGKLHIISVKADEMEVETGSHIVYIGLAVQEEPPSAQ